MKSYYNFRSDGKLKNLSFIKDFLDTPTAEKFKTFVSCCRLNAQSETLGHRAVGTAEGIILAS